MTDQERQGGMRPLERARGLIGVWGQVRMEEMMRLRRGDLDPMIRVLGWGRAATLALLHEMATQNATRTLGPIHQITRGRGGGLNHLLGYDNNHDENYPSSGMGRARVRNPGPCFPEPMLHFPYTWPQCL